MGFAGYFIGNNYMKNFKNNYLSIVLLGIVFLLNQNIFAQTEIKDEEYIQFTGLVLSADSLQPLSYTVITIPGTRRGTIADHNGYFTIVAKKGEKLVFELLGYKKSEFVLSDTFKGYKYSVIKLLSPDTIYLVEIAISPQPERE